MTMPKNVTTLSKNLGSLALAVGLSACAPSLATDWQRNAPNVQLSAAEIGEPARGTQLAYAGGGGLQRAAATRVEDTMAAASDRELPAAVPSVVVSNGTYSAQADYENIAQANDESPKGDPAKCAAFAQDPNADVGAIMRAGCEPSLAQMSALMDNPLGNVAMLFTQFDATRLENDSNGRTADQYLYTGIAQFPKKLNDDWNLINRVVWTAPSAPVNQDRNASQSSDTTTKAK